MAAKKRQKKSARESIDPSGGARPVSLSEIKADPAFAGWDLIRNSRLSVMSVPEGMWKRIEKLAEIPAE